jgi:hypothetical protein
MNGWITNSNSHAFTADESFSDEELESDRGVDEYDYPVGVGGRNNEWRLEGAFVFVWDGSHDQSYFPSFASLTLETRLVEAMLNEVTFGERFQNLVPKEFLRLKLHHPTHQAQTALVRKGVTDSFAKMAQLIISYEKAQSQGRSVTKQLRHHPSLLVPTSEPETLDESAIRPRPWIERLHRGRDSSLSADDYRSLFDGVRALALQKDFSALQNAIGELDLQRAPVEAIVAVLRLTYSNRLHLSSWASLLHKAEQEIKDRGFRPEEKLRGLNVP